MVRRAAPYISWNTTPYLFNDDDWFCISTNWVEDNDGAVVIVAGYWAAENIVGRSFEDIQNDIDVVWYRQGSHRRCPLADAWACNLEIDTYEGKRAMRWVIF